MLILYVMDGVNVQLEALLKLFPIVAYRNLALQCLTEVNGNVLQSDSKS